MIKKIGIVCTSLLVIGIVIIGLQQKKTYTNSIEEPEFWNEVYVEIQSEETVKNKIKNWKDVLFESEVIVRVTAVDELEIMYQQNRQKVQVEEVYKGEDIAVGTYIYITSPSWRIRLGKHTEVDRNTLETRNVNIMRVGEQYLIFLDAKLEAVDFWKNEQVYPLVKGIGGWAVFCYEERENKILDLDVRRVLYKDVAENEFFVETEEALELLLQLKEELLKKYPREECIDEKIL